LRNSELAEVGQRKNMVRPLGFEHRPLWVNKEIIDRFASSPQLLSLLFCFLKDEFGKSMNGKVVNCARFGKNRILTCLAAKYLFRAPRQRATFTIKMSTSTN
jgi:hypothetical protein